MDINPISTKRIYQSIVEQFVNLIKDGKLQIGQKLPPERTLAEMFNVSRASIREAFSAMEIVGIIDVRPGEGAFVSHLNIAPFINTIAPLFIKNETMEEELLEFRKMIEIEAVKLAAQKITAEKLKLLETSLQIMRDAIEKNDSNLGVEADIKFHKTIFSLTDNFILIKASECIASILECSVKFNREKMLKDSNNAPELNKQHILIYEAIKNGDANLAMQGMENHLNFVASYLKNHGDE